MKKTDSQVMAECNLFSFISVDNAKNIFQEHEMKRIISMKKPALNKKHIVGQIGLNCGMQILGIKSHLAMKQRWSYMLISVNLSGQHASEMIHIVQ